MESIIISGMLGCGIGSALVRVFGKYDSFAKRFESVCLLVFQLGVFAWWLSRASM